MFLRNTTILSFSGWTFGCAVKSATARPPRRKRTARNGDRWQVWSASGLHSCKTGSRLIVENDDPKKQRLVKSSSYNHEIVCIQLAICQ